MSEARKRAVWPIVAALVSAQVLVPAGLYTVGYFAMCKRPYRDRHGIVVRLYDEGWKARVYRPAATIETRIRGTTVATAAER